MIRSKFSFSTIFAVLLGMCMTSCSSDDYSSPLKNQTVGDQTFEAGATSKTITIGAEDISKCTASSSANWCSVAIQVSSVVINVQPNETYEERQATVTLTDPEDATTLSFRVVQSQNNAILVDGQTFKVPEEGGEVSIKVQSNVSYTVDIPASAAWLTKASSTRGLTSSTIVLKASKNDSGDERETMVKLIDSASGTSSQFTVKQELTPVVTLDKTEFNLDEIGGEIEVRVNANIALDIKFGADWLSDGGKTETGGFNFVQKIKVAAITDNQGSREATVSFSDKDGKWNIKKDITVKQIKSLSIQDSNVEIMIGKSFSLNVINNTGGTLSWKSSNTSVATVNSNGKVTGMSKGTATITVTSSDGKHSDQCTVTVKDITDLITARSGGGSIVMINDLIRYGSSLGWVFANNSSETVTLKSLQLVDGVTGSEGNIMTVDKNVPAGSSVSYSTTIGLLGIHAPVTCRFRYVYNGKEYMTTAVYSSIW